MPDIADRAEFFTELSSTPRKINTPWIKPKGKCHYCEEKTEQKQLFCDAECAQEYERERQLKLF